MTEQQLQQIVELANTLPGTKRWTDWTIGEDIQVGLPETGWRPLCEQHPHAPILSGEGGGHGCGDEDICLDCMAEIIHLYEQLRDAPKSII